MKKMCVMPEFGRILHFMTRHARLVIALAFAASNAWAQAPEPTGPQPPLPAVTLRVGNTKVDAEVASTPETRMIGLMGRGTIADGTGMLFVFPAPQPLSFWMRNTLVPLSIAYINGSGVIREIHDLQPLDEKPVRSTFRDLVYALEVPQGWFQQQKILPGDRILGLPSPSTAVPD